MKIEIHLLRFYARVWDPESETNREVPITLTKDQLRAAGLLEMSSTEVISRICKRWGLQLLEAGKAERRTVTLDLDELWRDCTGEYNTHELMKVIDDIKKSEQEIAKKREEKDRLTHELPTFDSQSLGDAVKCHISDSDPAALSNSAFEAFGVISKIQILEMEC